MVRLCRNMLTARTGLREVKKANGETTHYVFEGTEPIYQKKLSSSSVK